MSFDKKAIILKSLFGRWRRSCPFEPGYTILLPLPMDMPFLLRFALEGLLRMDTSNCKQILVVPDGWGDDKGRALQEVIDAFPDPRLEMVHLRWIDYKAIRAMRPPGCAATHWLMVVNGTTFARCEYAFLHDADAFFLEADGLERQYRLCQDNGMYSLGVTARWDPSFLEHGYSIPGTWELMYSTRWVRKYTPYDLKGRKRETHKGIVEFDSLLYPQFEDYPSGKVGVMDPPPKFVHFNGTIGAYRLFRDANGKQVIDELFRLVLLAILESLVPDKSGKRVVPTVEELAKALTDPSAPVTYATQLATQEYPIFRKMIDGLRSPDHARRSGQPDP